jgi:hypothetical protein
VLWYSDTLEVRQWLIYYISRPLVGTWKEVDIPPAVLVDGLAKAVGQSGPDADSIIGPRKKDIRFFHELLSHFPVIARQMQPGLEKLFRG